MRGAHYCEVFTLYTPSLENQRWIDVKKSKIVAERNGKKM